MPSNIILDASGIIGALNPLVGLASSILSISNNMVQNSELQVVANNIQFIDNDLQITNIRLNALTSTVENFRLTYDTDMGNLQNSVQSTNTTLSSIDNSLQLIKTACQTMATNSAQLATIGTDINAMTTAINSMLTDVHGINTNTNQIGLDLNQTTNAVSGLSVSIGNASSAITNALNTDLATIATDLVPLSAIRDAFISGGTNAISDELKTWDAHVAHLDDIGLVNVTLGTMDTDIVKIANTLGSGGTETVTHALDNLVAINTTLNAIDAAVSAINVTTIADRIAPPSHMSVAEEIDAGYTNGQAWGLVNNAIRGTGGTTLGAILQGLGPILVGMETAQQNINNRLDQTTVDGLAYVLKEIYQAMQSGGGGGPVTLTWNTSDGTKVADLFEMAMQVSNEQDLDPTQPHSAFAGLANAIWWLGKNAFVDADDSHFYAPL